MPELPQSLYPGHGVSTDCAEAIHRFDIQLSIVRCRVMLPINVQSAMTLFTSRTALQFQYRYVAAESYRCGSDIELSSTLSHGHITNSEMWILLILPIISDLPMDE